MDHVQPLPSRPRPRIADDRFTVPREDRLGRDDLREALCRRQRIGDGKLGEQPDEGEVVGGSGA
jgi:hypothetical protein